MMRAVLSSIHHCGTLTSAFIVSSKCVRRRKRGPEQLGTRFRRRLGGKRRDFYGTLPPCRVRSVEGARVFVQDAFSRTIMLLAFQNSRGFTDSVRRVREARAALLQAAPVSFNNPRAAHARSCALSF